MLVLSPHPVSVPLAVGVLHDNVAVYIGEIVRYESLMCPVRLICHNRQLPSNRPVITASRGAGLHEPK